MRETKSQTRRRLLRAVSAATTGGLLAGCTDTSNTEASTPTETTTTVDSPSAYSIKEWLEDEGLVVLSMDEEDGKLKVITEMQFSKSGDEERIALIAETYARAVAQGYGKKLHGAVMTADASEQAQYQIRRDDANSYNGGEISFQEYLRRIMVSYCCR